MHGKGKDKKKMPKGGPALALVIAVGPPMKAKRKTADASKKRKESKGRKG